MSTQQPRLIAWIILSTLLAPPADAQADPETNPMEFLPLEVGNQWTFEHQYFNQVFEYDDYYGGDVYWAEPGSVKRLVVQALFGIPGLPYYPDERNSPWPDDFRIYIDPPYRELTLEIIHTEVIEGQEYFVFSNVPYDWPPVPNFFLAGQKVRFSDEGTLLIRWNGQDIPFYAFQKDSPYITPEYPVLQNENLPVEHTIGRGFFSAAKLEFYLHLYIDVEPPPNWGQITVVHFVPDWEDSHLQYFLDLGVVAFVKGYGLFAYCRREAGTGDLGWLLPAFDNTILPVSAVIGGQKLEFSITGREWTNVQPSSWGQLKARHRQQP